MPITDWPLADRPREKLLEKGAQHLTDAELLAVLLKTGIFGQTALDIARNLMQEHGSLKKLFQMPMEVFIQQSGIGVAKYAMLKAALELGKRYYQEELPAGAQLNSSHRTKRFLSERMREYPNEVFGCLFLTSSLRLIGFEELFHGTIDEASIYPREIVKRGLALNAAKVILVHNHPSGKASPSQADKEVTETIKQALALVEMEVIDHLIIGNPDIFSFADAGWL